MLTFAYAGGGGVKSHAYVIIKVVWQNTELPREKLLKFLTGTAIAIKYLHTNLQKMIFCLVLILIVTDNPHIC